MDCSIRSSLFEAVLSEITFGDGVEVIPENLCSYCTGLKTLSFPESLKEIGRWAFYGCNGIEKIDFNANLDSIAPSAFYNCEKLEAAHLTARVVGDNAFRECANIKELTISDNVRKIDVNNFVGAKIDSLLFPATLERVDMLLQNGHVDNVIVNCPDAGSVLDGVFGYFLGYEACSS